MPFSRLFLPEEGVLPKKGPSGSNPDGERSDPVRISGGVARSMLEPTDAWRHGDPDRLASLTVRMGSPVALRESCWNRLTRGLTGDPDRLASLTVRMDLKASKAAPSGSPVGIARVLLEPTNAWPDRRS